MTTTPMPTMICEDRHFDVLRRRIGYVLVVVTAIIAVFLSARLYMEQQNGKAVSEHAELILHSVPVAIVVCDRDGIIQKLNGEAERLIGQPSYELEGKDITGLLKPDSLDLELFEQQFDECVLSVASGQLHVSPSEISNAIIVTPKGREVPVTIAKRAVRYTTDIEVLAIMLRQLENPAIAGK